MMSKLIITGNPNPIVQDINNEKNFNDSIFMSNYIKAIKIVNSIIEKNSEYMRSTYKTFDNCNNNIVIFEGERGTGKTSCMLSLSELYKQKKIDEYVEKITKINNSTIEVTDLIDPSILNKESIVEIIVAKMLKECQNVLEGNEVDDLDRRELISKFENVFRDLKNIKKSANKSENFIYDEEIDDLEKLLLLSSSITLRENLKSLIDSYLNIMGTNKKFLLIQIDDIDLNITYYNNIVEDIRRYLIIPNVIIFISVKLEQIKSMLYQKNKKNNEYITNVEIEKITEKYIEKIFPNNHIVTMLDMVSAADKKNIIYEDLTIESYIMNQIYEKTGYKLIKPVFGLNFLVPNTLREINIFIYFLNTLENINEEKDKVENIKILADYLLNIQIKQKLRVKDYNFLLSLYNNRVSNCNLSIMRYLINKLLIANSEIKDNKLLLLRDINDYINKFLPEKSDEYSNKSIMDNLEFIKGIVTNNFPEANFSLGNLIRTFEICNTYFIDDYDIMMLEYIKLIYSIIVYKAQVEYLENNINENTDLQKFISRDMYGEFQNLYDFKQQMYRLKERVEIDKNQKTGVTIDEKEYSYEDVRKVLKSQDEVLYKIKYLFYNLVCAVNKEDKYLYLLREDVIEDYEVATNQKNFYCDGTLAITNIFYSHQIIKFIEKSLKKDEENKTFEVYRNEINTDLKYIINKIPFYNIEFLIQIFDKQVKKSNKTRIKKEDRCEFIIEFIEDMNEIINEVMNIELSFTSDTTKNKRNMFDYEKNILIKKLPVYKLLKNENMSQVIRNMTKYEEKSIKNKK